nr:LysR family transcriptional regulator [Jiella sonneratiae]
MHVDVSRLRALIAVHDFGSVQRACQLLGISQPAVSVSINHLESDLGLRLFSRTPSGMIATPAGIAATLCFKRVLSELRKITDDVESYNSPSSGLVCVGGLAYSRTALLPEALKRALRALPRTVVRTVEGPIQVLLGAMHAGDVDFLICAHPNPELLEGVAVEPIKPDPMRLFVSADHPLADRAALSAEEVAQFPFVLPPFGSVTRGLLDRVFMDEVGRPPTGSVETSSSAIIRYLLLHSRQISFRSTREFEAECDTGRIRALDLAFDLPDRSICVLQRCGVRHTAAVTEFLDLVRDVAGEA